MQNHRRDTNEREGMKSLGKEELWFHLLGIEGTD
jgi:hypothetical protein